MSIVTTSSPHDPVAWLLMFVRAARRAGAALLDPATAADAVEYFQQLPDYRRVLEQALFPLLKHRLRDDDENEQEETLRSAIFIASGTLQTCVELLPALPSLQPPEAASVRGQREIFHSNLEQHLDKMEVIILPALHTHLVSGDISQLASSLGHHAPQASSTSPPVHSPEKYP